MIKKIFFLLFFLNGSISAMQQEKHQGADKQAKDRELAMQSAAVDWSEYSVGDCYNYELFKTRVLVRSIAAEVTLKKREHTSGKMFKGLSFSSRLEFLSTPWGTDLYPIDTQKLTHQFVEELRKNGFAVHIVGKPSNIPTMFQVVSINDIPMEQTIFRYIVSPSAEQAIKAAELQLTERFKKEATDEITQFIPVQPIAQIVTDYGFDDQKKDDDDDEQNATTN
jgi:hypothetical protein